MERNGGQLGKPVQTLEQSDLTAAKAAVPVVKYLQRSATWGFHRFPSDDASAPRPADKRPGQFLALLTPKPHPLS